MVIDMFTALQDVINGRKIVHYTDGIEGCGFYLLDKIQDVVFSFISKLSTQIIKDFDDGVELNEHRLKPYMNAFEWKFSS